MPSPREDGAMTSRRLYRGSWLLHITKELGDSSEGSGGIWERQQEPRDGGIGLQENIWEG